MIYPLVNSLTVKEWDQIKQASVLRSRIRFIKGKDLIEQRVSNLFDIAMQAKYLVDF